MKTMLYDAFKILHRSKLLVITLIAVPILSIAFMLKFYGMPISIGTVVAPLSMGLKLSLYAFIVTLLCSYEYNLKLCRNGIEEIISTAKEKKFKVFMSTYTVLTVWVLILTVIIGICILIDYGFYNVSDPDNEYKIHIIQNVIVNVFLILELANLLGILFAHVKSRLVVYAIIIIMGYIISPMFEQFADKVQRADIGISLYPAVEFTAILPDNNDFMPNFAYGETISLTRISLILFWFAFIMLLIMIIKNAGRKSLACVGVISVICFAMFILPESYVNMDNNPGGTAAHDQYYYQEIPVKDEQADYEINKYTMDLKIKRTLTAKVALDINNPDLNEYKMTLYHGYKVKNVTNQKGEKLDFKQENDYITVKNTAESQVEKIIIEYKGYAPAYYSNYQGIYLPGDFAYYPRAGFVPLYDFEGMTGMKSVFVNKDTEFDVKVDYNKKIYTNLKGEEKHYKGSCDGFTMVAGFYKTIEFDNGNTAIYNYLNGEYHYKEDNFVTFDQIKESVNDRLKELDIKDTTIFVVPNVNQNMDVHYGNKQILTLTMAAI